MKIVGVETVHAGKVFNGSEEDIIKLLDENGYKYKVSIEQNYSQFIITPPLK